MKKKPRIKAVLLPLLLVVAGALLTAYEPIRDNLSTATIKFKIEHPPCIMPAAHKLYADENAFNGKYGLLKLLVTNTSNITAEDLTIYCDIPNYLPFLPVGNIPRLYPGQSVVLSYYPTFPQTIVDKMTPSMERVNVTAIGSNAHKSESFPLEIKGRNEFMYTFVPDNEILTMGEYLDNMQLISCFVTPEDPIIKYFTQQIQEKILKGDVAMVNQDPNEAVRFLKAIYQATNLSGMVYSGTSGVPSSNHGVTSITQNIRLPREVITGKTGLCIELSILYASVLMTAGLDPVIYFMPGHAYPGFKMNGYYYAIEATGIGGDGLQGGRATVDQALQAGMDQLNDFLYWTQSGDDQYQILDVRHAIAQGAVAMELKDDYFLRQKVDEIAQSFAPRLQWQSQQPTVPSAALEYARSLLQNLPASDYSSD